MRVLKAVWKAMGALGVVLTLLAGVPSVVQTYGIDVGPFLGWFADNSFWLLPSSCFVLGLAVGIDVGWSLRDKRARKEEFAATGAGGGEPSVPQATRKPNGQLSMNDMGLAYFPPAMARAALAAWEARGRVPEEHKEAALESIKRNDGVFWEDEEWFMGAYTGKKTGGVILAREWFLFLDDDHVLAKLRETASR